MDRLLHWSMGRGARRTVIIGSDSPSLPPAYIDQALELLKEHEVVLGPSTDGGYYLVGQSSPNGAIFVDIDWSTGRVLEQTLDKVGTRSLGLLPPWYDVDTSKRFSGRAAPAVGTRCRCSANSIYHRPRKPPDLPSRPGQNLPRGKSSGK